MIVWLLLIVGFSTAQINFNGVHEEKKWVIKSCGASDSVEVDVLMGFGYITTPNLTVLVDYNTNEVAFKFVQSSRCLVAPLNTDIFADHPNELEMNAAAMSFQHGGYDTSKFKKYKVVRASDNIDPNAHFKQQPGLDKIHSDLIVETCEDSKSIATASIQAIDDSDGECKHLDQFNCVMKNKICESAR